MKIFKTRLTFWQIINMNFGFLGLQYSFGLQQANMSPIYSYLGAQEKNLPYLWLAGPITGLLLQPIVGVLSDHTVSKWGRRTPYFLVGAILCSICLFVMPHSTSVWMAASTLWILDAANNITQEPYRAFVSDKLDESQHAAGFLTQSAFTGLGQTLSYLTPSLLIFFGVGRFAVNEHHIPLTTIIAFNIGGVISIAAILWSLKTTPEAPSAPVDGAKSSFSFKIIFGEIATAIKEMPVTMKTMIPMMFFSWYAMFIYWIYITKCVSVSVFTGQGTAAFRLADILTGQIGAYYNLIAFVAAFFLMKLARRWNAKLVHGFCLLIAGIGLITLPLFHSSTSVFIPITGLGLCWASMMGCPYVILASSLPAERTGVYMGIFNMFIVVPMLLQNITMPLYYQNLLSGNPVNAIKLAGILMIFAALTTLLIKTKRK